MKKSVSRVTLYVSPDYTEVYNTQDRAGLPAKSITIDTVEKTVIVKTERRKGIEDTYVFCGIPFQAHYSTDIPVTSKTKITCKQYL